MKRPARNVQWTGEQINFYLKQTQQRNLSNAAQDGNAALKEHFAVLQ